jgi:ATP-dependent DNA helicase
MLRRLKQDVELKLPPKKELLVYAPMSSMQQEFYTSTVDRTIMEKIHEKNVSRGFHCVQII